MKQTHSFSSQLINSEILVCFRGWPKEGLVSLFLLGGRIMMDSSPPPSIPPQETFVGATRAILEAPRLNLGPLRPTATLSLGPAWTFCSASAQTNGKGGGGLGAPTTPVSVPDCYPALNLSFSGEPGMGVLLPRRLARP